MSYEYYNWISDPALKLPLSDVRLAQEFANSLTEICMSEYAKVASLSELICGAMKMVTLNGEDILLANIDGKIHAVSDLCSHADASLSDGYIEEDEVSPLSIYGKNLLNDVARNHTSFVKNQVPLPGRNYGLKFDLSF
mgnify:CR=1 FL=1